MSIAEYSTKSFAIFCEIQENPRAFYRQIFPSPVDILSQNLYNEARKNRFKSKTGRLTAFSLCETARNGQGTMGKNIATRRSEILNMVNKFGALDFPQLRAAFPGVSDVTLRKDLQYLDDTKQAIRTHGGIKSIPSALNYIYRANVNQDKKKAVASTAAQLIQPGESVFISAGTTCSELARCLPVFPLKVCSDGICTVSNIATLPNVSVELLGGEVDLNIMRVEGISVLNRLDALRFSTAFISALCINPSYGFAHNSALTVAILEKVVERSDRTVVLLDSTKISGAFYPYTIPLSSVDAIVTDSGFPPALAEELRSKGIEVIL